MADLDAVIVGAGAAGVAAARRLADRGRRTLLIEATDRTGGRARTVQLAGQPCDLGCGWLHSGERNPWVGIAEAAGIAIDRSPTAWGAQYRNLRFPEADQRAAAAAMAAFHQRLRTAPPPSDVAGEAIAPDDPWRAYVEAISTYLNGAGLDTLSAADFLAYEDAASDINWRVPTGYGALIAGHARHVETRLGTPVRAVRDADGSVAIETEAEAGTVRARGAIVTVSTAVLAGGGLALPPALDPAVAAAADLPLGLADKLFLGMREPDVVPPETHLLGDPRRADTGSYYMRPLGRPLIEVFLGGAAARALEAPDAAADFALAELTSLLGAETARTFVPLAATRWAAEPFVGGSYSHARPGRAAARATLAAPHHDRVLLAGEACSPHDFSTAHGAYATGILAADRLDAVLARG